METASDTDVELVRACQGGDKAPFCRLVERYHTLACAVAFSATGDADAARDVAQEAFVTAWRQLPALREPARFRSWLCGIVRNTARGHRRHCRRHAPDAGAPADGDAVELPAPSMQAELERRERLRVVARALDALPDSYREPLVLFYWSGQSIEEVAASLELTPQTVRQRLCRGRKQLERGVRGLLEDALAGARPLREGAAIAVIAAIITAERDAAAVAAGAAAGSWFGAGLASAVVGVAALAVALVVAPWRGGVVPSELPKPSPERAALLVDAATPRDVVAAAEPAPLRAVILERGPERVEPAPVARARRTVTRARPRGIVSHGRIEIARATAPTSARIELPMLEPVFAPPPRPARRLEIEPPKLDLMRDLVDL